MPVNRVEALVDALAHLKGAVTNPDGDLYQARNPIGVQNFSRPGKNTIDQNGMRLFTSWLAGYRASCFDLEIKIKGESRAGIKKDDKLENLMRVLGFNEKLGQDQILKFLKRALKDTSISRTTPLSYFLEENK